MKKNKNGIIEVTNQSDSDGLFTSYIPLVQQNGSFVIQKSVGEGEGASKNFFFIGEASNTNVDKGDDRMSKNFIQSMKKQLIGLNVFAEHEHDIEKTLGYVSATDGTDDSVTVETALENPEENSLVKSILKKAAHGTKFYYSVLGRITKAYKKKDEILNKTIREIDDGEIYEVSITALPEGNVSFAMPIMKSFKSLMKNIDINNDGDDDNDNSDDTGDDFGENDEDVTDQFTKALEEMMENNKIRDDMWNLFYSFTNAIREIAENDSLEPAVKKEKIMNLSAEYSDKVESMSNTIADLVQKINEDLGVLDEV
jgi:hypothetical protein